MPSIDVARSFLFRALDEADAAARWLGRSKRIRERDAVRAAARQLAEVFDQVGGKR